MPHLLTERSIAVLNFCALTQHFRHIGGWSACKLAFLIALAWSPGLQATPPSFERMAVYELYFFSPQKMQIFESSNKNTISTTALNYGDHWDFDVSIFLKMDRFEGAKPHNPLKTFSQFI